SQQDSLIRNAQSARVSSANELQSRRPQRRSTGLLIALLALILIAGSAGVTVYILRSTPPAGSGHNGTPTVPMTSTPTATTQTATYPNVTGSYSGNIHNTVANIITSMTLSINQSSGQSSISGAFTVGPELRGTGPFTGAVNPSGNIQFTVQSNQLNEPLLFTGTAQSNGSMSGTYCSIDAQNQCDPQAGRGTWNVTRSS